MKIITAVFLPILFCQSVAAQSISLHNRKAPATVFDSVLVEKIGLNCNQYYNKVISDYYKKNNYMGLKDGKHIINVSKETPLIVINNAVIDVSKPFKELQQFKELTSSKFLTFEETASRYGTNGVFGVFMFTAK